LLNNGEVLWRAIETAVRFGPCGYNLEEN
jgi:hypothetical protein